MLAVRPTAYIVPVAEQVLDDITPVIQVTSTGDEDARVTGLVRIYRESTSLLIWSSELAITIVTHGTTVNIAALSAWSPPAPADDDYFICVDTLAVSLLHSEDQLRAFLGAYHFDVKPGPMGPAPAAHGGTHEDGGMDELVVTALSGLLADDQNPVNHHADHENGGGDEISVAALSGLLADPQTPLAHAATHADGGGDDVDHATLDNLTAGDPHTQYQLETSVLTAAIASVTPQTLADGAAIDWDLALGGAAQVTLAGDRTMNAPTNMISGQRYRLKVIQDGTGTRLLTWNAVYRFPGGVDPCLSAAPGNIDILLFDSDGTHMDCVGMVSALA